MERPLSRGATAPDQQLGQQAGFLARAPHLGFQGGGRLKFINGHIETHNPCAHLIVRRTDLGELLICLREQSLLFF
jgi:hypothetical protein